MGSCGHGLVVTACKGCVARIDALETQREHARAKAKRMVDNALHWSRFELRNELQTLVNSLGPLEEVEAFAPAALGVVDG